VSGMHYTGIAAMHVYGTQNPGMLAAMTGGVSAQAFLLPLIVGISLLAFALTVIISLSPTEAEMREDAALMAHLAGRPAAPPADTHRAEPDEPDAGRWFRSQSLGTSFAGGLCASFAVGPVRQLRGGAYAPASRRGSSPESLVCSGA
jgi:hypothetical protein